MGLKPRLISAVRAINKIPGAAEVIDLIEVHLGRRVSGRNAAVPSLGFQPDTDDMRESPGLQIVHELMRRGATVVAHDPIITDDISRVQVCHPSRSLAILKQPSGAWRLRSSPHPGRCTGMPIGRRW